MARTTPAQNPRGCARNTSMGRPLRKLHQTHTVSPRDQDICNIRTTIRFRIHPAVKRMNARGFVSKNNRIEKADRKKDQPYMAGGIIVQ
jgi:hypothetical protein